MYLYLIPSKQMFTSKFSALGENQAKEKSGAIKPLQKKIDWVKPQNSKRNVEWK